MDVSKNKGTPKWMVYNGLANLIKMDDLGGTIIFGNTHIGSPPNLHPLSTKGWFFIEFFNRSERRQPEAPYEFSDNPSHYYLEGEHPNILFRYLIWPPPWMPVTTRITSTGRKFALVEGLSHDLESVPDRQVWHGQLSPRFGFDKLKSLSGGGN